MAYGARTWPSSRLRLPCRACGSGQGAPARLLHSQPGSVGCAGFPAQPSVGGIPERETGVVTRPAWVLPSPPGQECQGVPEHACLRPGSAELLGASVGVGGRLDPAKPGVSSSLSLQSRAGGLHIQGTWRGHAGDAPLYSAAWPRTSYMTPVVTVPHRDALSQHAP